MSRILLVEPLEAGQLALLQQLRQAGFYVDAADNHTDALKLERNYGSFDFYVMADRFPILKGKLLDTRVFMLAQDIHDRRVSYERMAVISDSINRLEMSRLLGIPNTYRRTQIPNPSPIERDRKYLAEDITRILADGRSISSTTK